MARPPPRGTRRRGECDNMKWLRTFIFVLVLPAIAAAQGAAGPCSSDKMREFDFWVGEWNLEWKSAEGEIQKGTNRIDWTLGGCVLREQFDGGESMPLKGQSYSMFDRLSGKWKQTWVDNMGSYLDFTGGREDAKMVLQRSFVDKQGNEIRQRMVFFNVKEDSLDWNWERSDDGGKTWKLAWHIRYSRKAK